MKTKIVLVLIALILSACGSVGNNQSANSPTVIIVASPTVEITSTVSPTPTTPMIQVGNIQVLDPQASNPELFDVFSADSPIVQFRDAMSEVGITIDMQQVTAQLENPQNFEVIKGADGKTYVLTLYTITNKNNTSYTVGLIAEQEENQRWQWKDITVGLKALANSINFQFGSQVVYYKLNDPSYNNIIKGDYNLYMIDGELNEPSLWLAPLPGETDPSKKYGNYDYTRASSVVSTAAGNGAIIQAHHLIDARPTSDLPNWLIKGDFSRQVYIDVMQTHIKSTMTYFKQKYPGIVQQYTVVNEAFDWNKLAGFWYGKIGSDFINLAFQTARTADPNAVLLYNDVNVFNEGKVDDHDRAVFSLVKGLKQQGLIDGIGLEMHLDANNIPSPEIFRQLIEMYKQLGVKVYVTEFDIDFSNFKGTEADKQILKAKVYGKMLDVALQENRWLYYFWFYGSGCLAS